MNNDNNNTTSSCIDGIDEGRYSLDRNYELLDEIPSSGFNRLILAERYGKQFLLKGLKPEYLTQSQYVALLQKEFEIALTLSHPNIARIYSFEEIPQIGPCIVMEYVDGRPLDKFLQENPSIKMRQRAIRQMLDAMAYYHSLQVVHRDLKPSNILVTHNGNNIRIIDFGCSDSDQYLALKQPSYTLAMPPPNKSRDPHSTAVQISTTSDACYSKFSPVAITLSNVVAAATTATPAIPMPKRFVPPCLAFAAGSNMPYCCC